MPADAVPVQLGMDGREAPIVAPLARDPQPSPDPLFGFPATMPGQLPMNVEPRP